MQVNGINWLFIKYISNYDTLPTIIYKTLWIYYRLELALHFLVQQVIPKSTKLYKKI